MSALDEKLAVMPLPRVEKDLTGLGPSGAGWHIWPYGGEIALVRRVDTIDPSRPRPTSYRGVTGSPSEHVDVQRGGYTDLEWRQRFIAVIPLMFTHMLVWGFVVDALEGHEDRWCYHTALDAVAAGTVWKGTPGTEPDGWHRHPKTGRREKKAHRAAQRARRAQQVAGYVAVAEPVTGTDKLAVLAWFELAGGAEAFDGFAP